MSTIPTKLKDGTGKSPREIIIRPIITEKATAGLEEKKYTFKVRTDANKIEIKQAVEALFKGVEVESVNTIKIPGKKRVRGRAVGYTPDYKKAIVKVTEKSKPIEFFEGLA
ncbi:MAG: 50S ribosomal protein L23 [Oscillospiraceae bacterium]|jgi:large subunit ribosomal protein L23|nr:50S ribosomal protein L23 [Oscillospiraceae bacterium]